MQGLRARCIVGCTVFSLTSPLLVHAAGLRVPVDNGLGIPGAAGGAALAIDASTGITNPAGLVRMQDPELVVAVNPAFTSTEFTGSATIEKYVPPIPQPGTRTGDVLGKLNVPLIAIHFSFPLRDFLVYGFSFNNPFGQSVNFPENSIVNSTVTEATLVTWNIANSLGYLITKNWSIGAGFDVQRLDFEAQNIFPSALLIRPDFYTKNEASDWRYGWHGGVMYRSDDEKTRLGFNYRSQIDHDASGKSYSTVTVKSPGPPLPPVPLGGENINRDFTIAFELPPIYTLSGFHTIGKWDLMGTVEYSQWSVFENIRMTNVVNLGDKIVPQDYHNTWTFMAGTYYHWTDKFYFGLGLRYDQTPLSDEYRGVEFPDSNVWVAGFSTAYQFNKVVRLEIGYAHSFFKQVHIDTYDPDSSVHNVGEGKLYGDVINTQLTINLAPSL